MNNRTNYHSHCLFCDGRADMETFVRFAVAEGFSAYGFSSHAPLPFEATWTLPREQMPQYLAEFKRLKERYAGQIELYVGLEIDYLDDTSNPASEWFQQLPLDYRIGSVHLLPAPDGRIVDIDTSAEKYRQIVDTCFGGDLEYVVRLYFQRLRRMVQLGGFNILGHADKMHYNAQQYRPGLLDEPWYRELMETYWNEVARSGCVVEVNTKAYARTGVFFPNERYFPWLRDLQVRVTVDSDAHEPDKIESGRPQALKALREAGFRSVAELHRGVWEEVPIRCDDMCTTGKTR